MLHPQPHPLGRNHHGYHGETLDVPATLEAIQQAAIATGWQVEPFGQSGPFALLGLHRPADPVHRRFYLSAGIHGDEPAGPLALLQLLQANVWPAGAALWMCPCLNPAGLQANRREGPSGHDLNRDYRTRREPEVLAHTRWLDAIPGLDLALCLHEDWEAAGFYLYELNSRHHPSLAEPVIAAVGSVCPIDTAGQIDGRPARDGIIRPPFHPGERPDWPEAFYLATRKSSWGYTFEAPSDFPLPVRVQALVTAVQTALAAAASTA